MKCAWAAAAVALLAAPLVAQPEISGVQNIYSYILPGMPNYGIAQGSIFGVFGAGLAPAPSALQATPLPKSLDGVSLVIVVNGVITPGILYYVSPTAIVAVLPSATPVGNGNIKVTVNGASAFAPITVVTSAFGMIALNNAGNGPAAAFDLNANYLGLANAANPGEFITLWGSGLGAVSGDETMPPPIQNLATPQLEVDIGGISATIEYAGRTVYPGLDQINVQVPLGVSGCHVSVVVRSGDMVSNFGTIPVATSGRACAEPVAGLTAGQIQSLASQPTVNSGLLDFVGEAYSSADARFQRFTSLQFALRQPVATVSFNDCTVLNFTHAISSATALPTPIVPNTITPIALDAGPSIELTTPSASGLGNPTLAFDNGAYGVAGLTSVGSFKGAFTFTGTGGADVGAFTAQIAWPGNGGGFTYTTPGNAGAVTRANGLAVTWNQPSHPDPDEFVQIYGFAFVPNRPRGAEFFCNVALSAQQFTIPPAVLLALPSQASLGAMPTAVLEVNLIINKPFSAPGIDLGAISFEIDSAVMFSYQ